ncbi:hypothetical protein [Lutispora sp.]|uniref:hypothetical protein n=1 Tax=Lutispora sp. TaxID=2828727 RepID=UPI0035638227
MRVKLCLDLENFLEKPEKTYIPVISDRIANLAVEIEVEELAQQLTYPNGKSFTPAYFNKDTEEIIIRKDNYWAGQQLFALDFDGTISIDEFLDRCRNLRLLPAFVYSTFTSIKYNKFRAVFILEHEVTDKRIRDLVQFALMKIFNESDPMCKDSCRLFFGGKRIIHSDFNSTINVPGLIESLSLYLHMKDKSNYSREMKSYCQSVGVNLLNGLPHVISIDDNASQFDENASTPIIINNKTCPDFVKNSYAIYFSEKVKQQSVKGYSKSKLPKYEIDSIHFKRKYIRDFNWHDLENNCPLYKGFINGTHWAYHNELFGIATNLMAIKGGQKRFIEALHLREEYDIERWEYYCNYIIKKDYKPHNCINFCPFCNECEHTKNMIEQSKLPRGYIRVVNQPQQKTLSEAEAELSQYFSNALFSEGSNVHVIKSPPGLGKTEKYLGLKNVIIAVPNHALKAEVVERIKEAGYKAFATPEFPELPDNHSKVINKLYQKGNWKGVQMYLRKIINEENNAEVIAYFNELENMKHTEDTIVTTHERLLHLNDLGNNKTVIIDEDITFSLLRQDSVSLRDLSNLESECFATELYNQYRVPYEFAKSAEYGIIHNMHKCGLYEHHMIHNIVYSSKYIESNVLDFLDCDSFIRIGGETQKTDIIYYMKKRTLPDTKIIMLSATANESICKLLFGNRLNFYDVGNVESKGQLIQYPQKSYSRYSIENNPESIEKIKPIIRNQPVITFKKHTKHFNDIATTFGSVTGLNKYSGENIAVVGTPHINPIRYLLFAHVLGIEFNDNDCEMSYQLVQYNGYEFRFQTYKQESLRNIQFYFIESEIIQAVGRGRILRNECTVTLFSNYPVPGAKFKYLNNTNALMAS